MQIYLEGHSAPINLSTGDFVAEGGQGKVFARGDVAYKVFHDPGQVPPVGKMNALRAIDHPGVLVPETRLLDSNGQVIGYTQRFVHTATPLCSLFSKAWRRRHQITEQTIADLVLELREMVCRVHAASTLVVDLNEMNFLVADEPGGRRLYAIDTDSYQTPGYPATALSERVRDRQGPQGVFNEGTDWFAFAVVSFQMFRGVHPFQGKHPTVKGLDARMQAGVSVLDDAVRVPGAALGPEVIPQGWQSWYWRVFQEGHRGPPPATLNATATTHITVRPAVDDDSMTRQEVHRAPGPILAWLPTPRGPVYVSDDRVWLGDRPVMPLPGVRWALVLSPRGRRPVLVWLDGSALRGVDLLTEQPLTLNIYADDLAPGGDQVLYRSGADLYTLTLKEIGPQLIAAPRRLTPVTPLATTLLHGCALDHLDGLPRLHVSQASGACHTLRLPDLQAYRTLTGARHGGVIMLIGQHQSGRWDRITIRTALKGHTLDFDLHVTEDVDERSVSFALLDTGVLVSATSEGLLLQRSKVGQSGERQVPAGGLPVDHQIYCRDDALLACGPEGDDWVMWRLRLQ
ncbi:MAG: hypothetical protein ACE366_20995 [Bradymonadia bacterium]